MRSFLILPAVVLVGCLFGPPPGQGAKAERGYDRSAIVIAAIDSFARHSGQLPDSLTQLVPAFLDRDALSVPSSAQERYPLMYQRAGDRYELEFRYVGPGMNWCRYASARREWKCGGHY